MKVKKKPTIVDAILWDETEEMFDVLKKMMIPWIRHSVVKDKKGKVSIKNLQIETFEGRVCVRCGDYVVKESSNEFCVVKPDVFAKIYDEVKE